MKQKERIIKLKNEELENAYGGGYWMKIITIENGTTTVQLIYVR